MFYNVGDDNNFEWQVVCRDSRTEDELHLSWLIPDSNETRNSVELKILITNEMITTEMLFANWNKNTRLAAILS